MPEVVSTDRGENVLADPLRQADALDCPHLVVSPSGFHQIYYLVCSHGKGEAACCPQDCPPILPVDLFGLVRNPSSSLFFEKTIWTPFVALSRTPPPR